MKNRIDLSLYDIRSDLLIESIPLKYNDNSNLKIINDNISVNSIFISDSLSFKLGKKKGRYITILFEDITNYEDRVDVSNVLTREIKQLLNELSIDNSKSCMIVGLGNSKSTADALGPSVVDKVMVTRHLFLLNTCVKDGIREVSAINPSVMANTGIESFDIISSVVKKVKPDFLIIIDSLASLSIDRLNKTIQITDTGINPGSGIGNNRQEISMDTLSIPVIAIGVPTVLYSSIIVNDTINYLFKHISYIKNNYDTNKLVFNRKNYNKKLDNIFISDEDKKNLSGIIGTLSDDDMINLINEVLNSLNYNLVVTPKEIDFLISKLSDIISNSINNAIHDSVNNNSIN